MDIYFAGENSIERAGWTSFLLSNIVGFVRLFCAHGARHYNNNSVIIINPVVFEIFSMFSFGKVDKK